MPCLGVSQWFGVEMDLEGALQIPVSTETGPRALPLLPQREAPLPQREAPLSQREGGSPLTSLTLTSFQNLFLNVVTLPLSAFRITLVALSSSACLLRRSILSLEGLATGSGGSGGGPVPTMGTTLAA